MKEINKINVPCISYSLNKEHSQFYLEDNKIQTRQYFGGNIMLNPGYTHLMDSRKVIEEFPIARKVTTDTFFLGTSPVLNEDKINYVGENVDRFMKGIK